MMVSHVFLCALAVTLQGTGAGLDGWVPYTSVQSAHFRVRPKISFCGHPVRTWERQSHLTRHLSSRRPPLRAAAGRA